MTAYKTYRLICLMVADLNDMCNNYDISEYECDNFKQSITDEIDIYNIQYKCTLTLIKKHDKYKLIY